MVDNTIKPSRPPIDNNVATPSQSDSPSKAAGIRQSSMPAHWSGADRRQRYQRRRLIARTPLMELRQKADRRRGRSISIKV